MHQLRRCATGVGPRGPTLRVFASTQNVEDDFAHVFADEVLVVRDGFGCEAFGRCIPDRCRTPGPHFPSECVSVEMVEDPSVEASDEKGDPT